ncbi:hypothetical protein ACP70R_004993 [Stipagrostis hirtigluma subsp. patula]
MGSSDDETSSSSSSSKRRRRNGGYARWSRPRRKQHLYLALDDWPGGYSIHKIDADDILDQEPETGGGEHKLPAPAAVRIASPAPVPGPMAFAAAGTSIFVATNPLVRGPRAPAMFVYDTETAALTIGPRVPEWIFNLADAIAVDRKLYAVTSGFVPSVQVLSWALNVTLDREAWEPAMEWSWKTLPGTAPIDGTTITSYALHPDGRTIFMSAYYTYSFDTGSNVWTNLGTWKLPFRGRAYFDGDLDAWVGLAEEDGYICCCPVASRSAAATRPPERRMLKEKLFHAKKDKNPTGNYLGITLTYMGDGGFCLVENIMHTDHAVNGSVLHVTFFGLKYDHKGELQTKVRCGTRSYKVSKNNRMFSHAAFWM